MFVPSRPINRPHLTTTSSYVIPAVVISTCPPFHAVLEPVAPHVQ